MLLYVLKKIWRNIESPSSGRKGVDEDDIWVYKYSHAEGR